MKEIDCDRLKYAIETVRQECYIFSLTSFDRVTLVNGSLDIVLNAARNYLKEHGGDHNAEKSNR